jgi:hypothetical protein
MTKSARTTLRLCVVYAFGAALLSAQGPPSGQRVHGRVNPAETQTLGSPVPGIPGTPLTARGNTVRIAGRSDAGASVDQRTMISADSTFEFSLVPPGEYQITAPPSSIPPVTLRVGNTEVPEVQLGVYFAQLIARGTTQVVNVSPTSGPELQITLDPNASSPR